MTRKDEIKCSQCGKTDGVGVRFAACVAESEWDKDNFPGPVTMTKETINEDIQPWRIPLCRTCLPNGYRSFLKDRLKKVNKELGTFSFLLILGAAPFYFEWQISNKFLGIIIMLVLNC